MMVTVLSAVFAFTFVGEALAFRPAPRDQDMLASFQSNQSEFEYWKDVFMRPDMNCFVAMRGQRLSIEATPCTIEEPERLTRFMRQVGIIWIHALKDSLLKGATPSVDFVYYSEGMFNAGHDKSIYYSMSDVRPLVDNLDIYDVGRISDPSLRKDGQWFRQIEENWYLAYGASL
jgi:hypothetical protein